MSIQDESFRDSINTITEDGKRKWVFAKKPSGNYYDKRKLVTYILIVFFLAAPFIKINGNQFLMFNVLERRFNIFGFPFWPQDFYLFVISMIIGLVALALFTVAFGRIFCGWICPQTIFMEMVFRRIEYWIEGDRGAQIRLSKQDWNFEKVSKKGLKLLVFLAISFLIANVFTAFLVGSDRLFQMILEGPQAHRNTMVSLIIFTGVFYFVFAWFREQVCIIACPYGRLQGALLDNKSIVVAYDHVRGEKEIGRAKFNKQENRAETGKGDCIDCKQCVLVCPTGIDIRNGTQLECVNCTACIDECDHMMESVHLPKGLIRFASEDEIVKKSKFEFTPRMKGYTAVLVILVGLLSGMLFLRNDVEAVILRLPGQLYEQKGDVISNVFTYKIVNKTSKPFENITLKLVEPKGILRLVGNHNIQIKKEGMAKGTLFVEINQSEVKGDKTKIFVEVYENNRLIETTTSNFMGPKSFN